MLTEMVSPSRTCTGLLRGINSGNQLNMPLVWVAGRMDSDTSLYKVDSKYPTKPCIVMLTGDTKDTVLNLKIVMVKTKQ